MLNELIKLLQEIQTNCGTLRGRDGEWLDIQVGNAIKLAKKSLKFANESLGLKDE